MGTGQYDYQILENLQSLNTKLDSVTSVINQISDNWLPLVCGCIIVVGVIGLLNWLVKL